MTYVRSVFDESQDSHPVLVSTAWVWLVPTRVEIRLDGRRSTGKGLGVGQRSFGPCARPQRVGPLAYFRSSSSRPVTDPVPRRTAPVTCTDRE